MSITKIIIIVIVSGIILFILMLYIALSPTIKNVSKYKILNPFLNKPLTLKTSGVIYLCDEGNCRFRQLVLTQQEQYPDVKKFDMPAGSVITIKEFKTYKNNAGSGFTTLFALGETTIASGEKVEFEYSWGTTDPGLYSKEPPSLPQAIWQDSTDAAVVYIEE